jgi:hypothetical protein
VINWILFWLQFFSFFSPFVISSLHLPFRRLVFPYLINRKQIHISLNGDYNCKFHSSIGSAYNFSYISGSLRFGRTFHTQLDASLKLIWNPNKTIIIILTSKLKKRSSVNLVVTAENSIGCWFKKFEFPSTLPGAHCFIFMKHSC